MAASKGRGRPRDLKGTVVQRGRRWYYVMYGEPDPVTGKRPQHWVSGFDSEDDAWDALIEANRELRDGTFAKPETLTVEEFLTRWLETVAVEIKPTTHANYTALAKAYVIPHIGQRNMRDIQPQTISELYRRLLQSGRRKRDTNTIMFEHWKKETAAGRRVRPSELARLAGVSPSAAIRAAARYRAGRRPSDLGAGLAPTTIASIHIMLRAAFNDAAGKAWRIIRESPVSHATVPRVPRSKRTTWKPDELTAFLRAARDERLFAMWLLFTTTGMRRSEAAGALITDLNLDGQEIAVGPTRVIAAGRVHDSDGKSDDSVRTFGLDRTTSRVLRTHLVMLANERREFGDHYEDHGLLFCWPDGRKIYPDTITRQFSRLVDKAGLPRIDLHDVRHTYATMALRARVDPKIVSERLGHAAIAFTLETYTDSVPELDQAEAERIAGLFLTPDLDLDDL
jgi:integrase